MRDYNSNLSILMFLAEKAGLHDNYKTSTSELALMLKTSQQTVSRKLRELEEIGLILRSVSNDGVDFRLAEKGRELLKDNLAKLQVLFQSQSILNGSVFSGLGEGKYYVGLDGYIKQFRKKLGFTPYAGTLNLNVDNIKLKSFLMGLDKIEISGFETKERTFGGIDCYKIYIDKVSGALIIPHRTLHDDDTVEIIASDYLRDKLSLKDGNSVRLQVPK